MLKALPFQVAAADTDPDRIELRAWLKRHRQRFIDEEWTIRDVSAMALAVGFHALTISQVFSHWSDAIAGTNFDNRAAFRSFSMEVAVEDFRKLKDKLERVPELDLSIHWKEVQIKQTMGLDWDEADVR